MPDWTADEFQQRSAERWIAAFYALTNSIFFVSFVPLFFFVI
jgi:hypothetical protein